MGRSGPWLRGVVAGVAAIAFFLPMPAQADAAQDSEHVRRLDIMLMVTGLRCRNTADDFQADFQAFEARHLADLNAAARDLAAAYAAQMGAEAAHRMVDRLSVQMANRYGNGHPWLGCRELKGLTQSLAAQDGRAVLVQAASETLDGDDSVPVPDTSGSAPAAGAKDEVSLADK